MKVFKGGYKIVSLLNIDITSDFTIPGIYDDIKDSHGKPILVSEINVGGEKMNDAYTIVKQDNTDYIIEVYGYSLTIASDDSVTVASLPEITSIGSGLDLTDGELSATGGAKLYIHTLRITRSSAPSVYVTMIHISTSNEIINTTTKLKGIFHSTDCEMMCGTAYSSSKLYNIACGYNYQNSTLYLLGTQPDGTTGMVTVDFSNIGNIEDWVREIQ